MRSKDRGMTNFEWEIPVDEEGNIVLYAHSFASSLELTKLANEDPLLQVHTKIDVLDTLKEHCTNTQTTTQDPYPRLDGGDRRRNMTDAKILRLKVSLDKGVLSAAEKEH